MGFGYHRVADPLPEAMAEPCASPQSNGVRRRRRLGRWPDAHGPVLHARRHSRAFGLVLAGKGEDGTDADLFKALLVGLMKSRVLVRQLGSGSDVVPSACMRHKSVCQPDGRLTVLHIRIYIKSLLPLFALLASAVFLSLGSAPLSAERRRSSAVACAHSAKSAGAAFIRIYFCEVYTDPPGSDARPSGCCSCECL